MINRSDVKGSDQVGKRQAIQTKTGKLTELAWSVLASI